MKAADAKALRDGLERDFKRIAEDHEPKDSEAAPQSGSESSGRRGVEAAPEVAPRLAPVVTQETRRFAAETRQSIQDVAPPAWWGPGVRVTDGTRAGVVGTAGTANGNGWIVSLDGGLDYVANVDPSLWSLEVLQTVNSGQVARIVYDCQRALLHAFGCHYVPAFAEITESQRLSAIPAGVNRPELTGLQIALRTAVLAALAPYKQD